MMLKTNKVLMCNICCTINCVTTCLVLNTDNKKKKKSEDKLDVNHNLLGAQTTSYMIVELFPNICKMY